MFLPVKGVENASQKNIKTVKQKCCGNVSTGTGFNQPPTILSRAGGARIVVLKGFNGLAILRKYFSPVFLIKT
ncbi:hypothetical protein NC99_13330 [Sunxiuqinia dokdonensis]|uniref:Uncharacterized protein n=1 Tax=Sunxiuqinia dokdonensis TaxID=1409788 RepID=A0A0L8VBM3_9BACT|nr:hypothetical protein NC99_13330 [Sunxiuqinia dokdonensis]